eukprot:TRINITY_DN1849_c0_g1_i3.p1 TRINITY_DN1849_c0_g1~~TRINITY_DN1849_c0_g1_i3.p1  ORF type:complete len:486 (-),score=60.97 TRINITY_DN1849_c0_g1_i3:129-1586(-)
MEIENKGSASDVPKDIEENSKAKEDSKQSAAERSHSSSRHRDHRRRRSRERSRSHSKRSSRHRSKHHSKHRSHHHSRHKSKHHSKHHSRHRSRHRDRSKSSKKSPEAGEVATKSNFDATAAQPDSTTPKPATDKYERELYIGNLPPELTNNQLTELLNRVLIRMKATAEPGNPILNTWIGSDGKHAFVVFRSVEETNMALSLKGVSLMGYPLKVTKVDMNNRASLSATSPPTPVKSIIQAAPKTVGEITASTAGYKMTEKLQLGNLPTNITEAMIRKLMIIFGKILKVEMLVDPVTKTPNGQCFVEYSNEVELQKAASGAMGMKLCGCILETKKIPITQTADTVAIGSLMRNAADQFSANPELADSFIGIMPRMNSVLESHPSRVIKFKNLVNVAELFDNNYYEEVYEDIHDQCKNFGRIIAIEIPRPIVNGPHVPGLGLVYVQYESVDSAMMAVKKLNGLLFMGRKVEAVYYPEDPFKKRILDL